MLAESQHNRSLVVLNIARKVRSSKHNTAWSCSRCACKTRPCTLTNQLTLTSIDKSRTQDQALNRSVVRLYQRKDEYNQQLTCRWCLEHSPSGVNSCRLVRASVGNTKQLRFDRITKDASNDDYRYDTQLLGFQRHEVKNAAQPRNDVAEAIMCLLKYYIAVTRCSAKDCWDHELGGMHSPDDMTMIEHATAARARQQ